MSGQLLGTTTVRGADPGDMGAIVVLVDQMGGHDGAGQHPATRELFGNLLSDPCARLLVVEHDGVVRGFAEIQTRVNLADGRREAWLSSLAVSPTHRRCGLGTTLIQAVEREACALGCDVIVLETSTWRGEAVEFYASLGFVEHRPAARRLARPVSRPGAGDLVARFLERAGIAAWAASGAVVGQRGTDPVGIGADGAPTQAADAAAERAVLNVLAPLGLPVVSEECGFVSAEGAEAAHPPIGVEPSGPWICVDPLDGSRNQRRGHPPWATAIGLVHDGQPLAGLVHEHASTRRWWAARGMGAWVDGRPARPAPGGLVAVPSVAPSGTRDDVPVGYERIRMSGATTVDLCRVADGSLGAFVDRRRAVVHPHDLAAPLAILLEAGAAVARPDGGSVEISADPRSHHGLLVAADAAHLEQLLGRQGRVHRDG